MADETKTDAGSVPAHDERAIAKRSGLHARPALQSAAMARYLQRISLQPYTDSAIWTGWNLEGRSGEIEGLVLADGLSDSAIAAKYGVTDFQTIPVEYLQAGEFRPKSQG